MLLVHDGAEYDQLARITTYSAALVAGGQLPPHRVALAHPVMRDAWYSGSPQYLRTIADAGLDRLGERYAVRGPIVVVGASLGGLTALLLGLLAAPRVGGVYSQSGSFFQVRHDDSESGYRYFGRISRLVQSVLDMRHAEHPLTVGMSCGALEENVANNRDMAAALRRAGHDVTLREVPDLHNYTAWRDALDPGLTEVLRTRLGPRVAASGCFAGCRPAGWGRMETTSVRLPVPGHDADLEVVRHGIVGPAGAAVPLGGRLGARRRAQRHARRRAPARRRRPGQPVLRRLARRVVVVRQRPPHRGAGPAGRHLHGLAVRRRAAVGRSTRSAAARR